MGLLAYNMNHMNKGTFNQFPLFIVDLNNSQCNYPQVCWKNWLHHDSNRDPLYPHTTNWCFHATALPRYLWSSSVGWQFSLRLFLTNFWWLFKRGKNSQEKLRSKNIFHVYHLKVPLMTCFPWAYVKSMSIFLHFKSVNRTS
jgi:hypothetical protein